MKHLKKLKTWALAAAISISIFAAPVLSQSIDISRQDESVVMTLTGGITPGISEMVNVMTLTNDVDTIVLSSNGGAMLEGLALARIIKENDLKVVVKFGDVCFSACAYATMGASEENITINGIVGFHLPSVTDYKYWETLDFVFQQGFSVSVPVVEHFYDHGFGYEFHKAITRMTYGMENKVAYVDNADDFNSMRFSENFMEMLPTEVLVVSTVAFLKEYAQTRGGNVEQVNTDVQ